MKGRLTALDEMSPLDSSLPRAYQGALGRHAQAGDRRLLHLDFHLSPAAHDLWNFLLTEEERLRAARQAGRLIVGALKDLGTIPVLVNAYPNAVAFYPDGAWWLPCFKEQRTELLPVADALGAGEGFCPVRAMLGAFELGCHFPMPDVMFCSTGAICDDFKAIAQRLVERGHPIHFWEMPHVRAAQPDEPSLELATGLRVPTVLYEVVQDELRRIASILDPLTGHPLRDKALHAAIVRSNRVRRALSVIRASALPSLERMICEMMALHYCSDYACCEAVLTRVAEEAVTLTADVRLKPVYWINPVADVRAMNWVEEAGGRLCGTDFMFSHALAPLEETRAPFDTLARMALADPMAGTIRARMATCLAEAKRSGARGLIVSRIPGASHCAFEASMLSTISDLPLLEIEIPSLADFCAPSLMTRLQGFIESI
jgi:2-hydroxyglutaryl-CoA dehydratase, D-component